MSANQITKLLSETWNKLIKDEQKEYKIKAAQMNAEEEVPCPKCGEKFLSNSQLINHLMTEHIEATAATSSITASSSTMSTENRLGNNQSTIPKCDICGKMFYLLEMLNDHKTAANSSGVEHAEAVGAQYATNSVERDVHSSEEPATNLVWAKPANQPWPAKIISKVDGEISEEELFDEEGTRKMIEHIKLKPFSKLSKIPRRSNIWKAAYARALQIFKM